MQTLFSGGSLDGQIKDIPEPLSQMFKHQSSNGDRETYFIKITESSAGLKFASACYVAVELSTVQHAQGFKFSNGRNAYPAQAYRVVDIVTGETIRIKGKSITFNKDDALQTAVQSSHSLLEIIDCFRVYDDESIDPNLKDATPSNR